MGCRHQEILFVKKACVVLVEGYMDFLKLYQGSVSNILATSGTAFTEKHVSALNRITKRLFYFMMVMMRVGMQL